MISLEEFLMGRDVRFPLTPELKKNALYLLDKIAHLETFFGERLILTSGYRPSQINKLVPGAAPHSTHQSCEGIDLHDTNGGELSEFLMSNLDLLKKLGLYMEATESAKDHIHLQTRPPKSGKRVFFS